MGPISQQPTRSLFVVHYQSGQTEHLLLPLILKFLANRNKMSLDWSFFQDVSYLLLEEEYLSTIFNIVLIFVLMNLTDDCLTITTLDGKWHLQSTGTGVV